MIAQAKLLRVFKLIRLLNQHPGRTIHQLVDLLDMSERTVYRYIELLDSIGYCIDSDPTTKRYFLFGQDAPRPNSFTEEETDLLRHLLSATPGPNPVLASIRQKLFLSSTLIPLADGLVDLHRSVLVSELVEAIRNRTQVWLIRYHSANSNSITDRLVEPLELTDNFSSLEAYEPASGTTKTFKVSRIEQVERTEAVCAYVAADPVNDLFNWSGPTWMAVSLNLTDRAYRLLIEDYPATEPDTVKRAGEPLYRYGWRGVVRDWRGIGRFVLGLPGEIQVEAPDEFRRYLHSRVAEFSF